MPSVPSVPSSDPHLLDHRLDRRSPNPLPFSAVPSAAVQRRSLPCSITASIVVPRIRCRSGPSALPPHPLPFSAVPSAAVQRRSLPCSITASITVYSIRLSNLSIQPVHPIRPSDPFTLPSAVLAPPPRRHTVCRPQPPLRSLVFISAIDSEGTQSPRDNKLISHQSSATACTFAPAASPCSIPIPATRSAAVAAPVSRYSYSPGGLASVGGCRVPRKTVSRCRL
jgi:hypothetical protein